MDDQYNYRLKNKIQSKFQNVIIPPNLLPAIKQCNSNILTASDEDKIRTVSRMEGHVQGAAEMLNLMHKYTDWFPCLLDALQCPEVQMGSRVEEFIQLKNELDAELAGWQNAVDMETQNSSDNSNSQFSRENSEETTSRYHVAAVESQPMATDAVESDGPIAMDEPYYCHIDESESSGAATSRLPLQRPLPNVPLSRPVPQSVPTAGYLNREYSYEVPQPLTQPLPQQYPKSKRKHGKEYDFSYEETRNALGHLRSWRDDATPADVSTSLQNYLDHDGYFILWYWAEKKRPTISVSFRRTFKNFVIHKKPLETDPQRVCYFYVNKSQHMDTSMSELVRFHLNEGIQNTEPGRQNEIVPLFGVCSR